MKATKIIALLLLFVIICQSCTYYLKVPVSDLKNAVGEGKSKAIRADGKKYKLMHIREVDGVYTGTQTYHTKEIELDPVDYKIYLKDNKKSKNWTIAASVGGGILALGVGFMIFIIISFYDY